MTDPTTAELAATIADLRRRIAALEGSTQLGRASVMGSGGASLDVAAGLDVATQASADAAQALAAASDAQAIADGAVVTFYNLEDDPPDDVGYGDRWVRVGLGNRLDVWDGDSWEPSDDARLQEALVAAQNAQDTADGKIVSTYGPDLPVAASQGDLHYLTSVADPVAGVAAGVVLSMWRWDLGLWVQLPMASLMSPNYAEGDAGARVDPNITQFDSVNVLHELGAETVTAQQVVVGGQDLVADLVDPRAGGQIAFGRFATTGGSVHAGLATQTEKILMELAVPQVRTGRYYLIMAQGHFDAAGNPDTPWDLMVRRTFDGSTPTTSSEVLDGSLTRLQLGSIPSQAFAIMFPYIPLADYSPIRLALSARLAAGTVASGTGGRIWMQDDNRAFSFTIFDMGLYNGPVDGAGLSQRAKQPTAAIPAPPPDPEPVSTYTRSWTANWSRSYDSDNGVRAGDDTSNLYQGYISGTHGNTRSLFGFDDESIRSALSGATIRKVTITFKVRHAWASAGIRLYLSAHDYSTKPSTWSGSRVAEDRYSWGSMRAGVTYTKDITGQGGGLKSGSIRGFGFGPAPSNSASAYYGYVYGTPKLTITFVK